ncbi:MAG: proline--tRNA ligase [Bifidobacteriaceae bacterium]|jgi:prolyl-tRNA synthetase|nr:proline--tRNA ligase [Bifidobacteriaceae bacterium]
MKDDLVIRMSTLFLRTLREKPNDTETKGYENLVRAGYIRRSAAGIFTWLPLGLLVLRKVEKIIREEMRRAGSEEVLFSALQPKEPYEKTKRWDEYGDGIFRLKDRKKQDYLLAPTHEEMFTLLAKDFLASYKDLPLSIYQIQNKFRDEARPRAGLLRGREFVMKDAYTFDISETALEKAYMKQREAYIRIFDRIGLSYHIVKAYSGAMGGSKSEEFLSPLEAGDDSYVLAPSGFAANVEAIDSAQTATNADHALNPQNTPTTEDVHTPNLKTVADLENLGFKNSELLKNVVVTLTHPNGEKEVRIIGLPGDRNLDEKRLEVAIFPAQYEMASAADFAKHPELVAGFVGPHFDRAGGVKYYVDSSVTTDKAWVSGANKKDYHTKNLLLGRDFTADGVLNVVEIKDGDLSPDGSGPLKLMKGVEIGHIFALGQKYSTALDLKVPDESGKHQTVWMGSYGIGVSRILAVLAESRSDDKGLSWTRAVSPADVHIVIAGKSDEVFQFADKFAEKLAEQGVSVLLDDRFGVSPGVKFKDSELLGIQTIAVIGKSYENEGVVEIKERDGSDAVKLPYEQAIAEITKRVREK